MTIAKEEGLIEVQFQNGHSEQGRLTSFFEPAKQKISISNDIGEDKAVPLHHVMYILFQSASKDLLPSTPSGEAVDEVVYTRDDERFDVRVTTGQDFSQGFFGLFSEARNGYYCAFFPWHGVRNREELRHLGEILRDEGIVSDMDLTQTLSEQKQLRSQRVGDILATQHGISRQEIEKIANEKQKDPTKKQPIGEILVSAHLITRAQLDAALAEQRKSNSQLLGDLLVGKGLISEDQLVMALALKFRMRYIDLKDVSPDDEALRCLPVDAAERFRVFPIRLDEHTLVVATAEPTDVNLSDMLRFKTNRRIELVASSYSQIKNMIQKHYHAGRDASDLSKLAIEFSVMDDDDAQLKSDSDLQSEAEKAPIVKLANQILVNGIRESASDIHVVPVDKGVKVSFRINGQLSQHLMLDKRVHKTLITRFKIISGMDISEHRLPQDGRVLMSASGRNIELRVSCMPGQYGETMVFRVLSRDNMALDLNALGFEDQDREGIRRITHGAHGILLVTGPTGSGKSTTLLAAMKDLTDQPKHLISLEDPIEAKIEGVNQIQINTKIGFTFASALRNVLRHDPDVIMVGEIRDSETAHIAVQASLTGHTLLSSLHTNHAVGAFSRLANMEVERYLIAATVKGVLAQHLIPKLCDACKTKEVVDDATRSALQAYDLAWEEDESYVPSGCDECRGTGIAGRLLVYELLYVNEEFQRLIIANAPDEDFLQACKAQGMVSMAERALAMARRGETSLEYVLPLLVE